MKWLLGAFVVVACGCDFDAAFEQYCQRTQCNDAVGGAGGSGGDGGVGGGGGGGGPTVAIAAGLRNTCGTRDGGLYCWGNNEYGQLGASFGPAVPTPVLRA